MIERNVVDVLVPETPKMLSKQEFFVYVPTATYDSPGVASYDKTTLIIQNGIVSVRGDFLDGVIEEGKNEVTKLIDEAIIIIDEKILKVSNFESKIDAIYSDIQRIGESAEINANDAESSAGNAELYASQAQASQISAQASEQSAISSANDSQQYASNAQQSAISAEESAELAKRFSELGISFNFQYSSVDELPHPGSTRFIYMIKVGTADTGDITENLFDEYVWVPDKNDYEQIGSSSVDLSNYAQISGNYPNMTVGNATNATNAQTATKASRDGNNNIINDTYATKQGLDDHVNDLNNPHEVTAAQVGAYVKPSGGIPETDLSTAVQNKLNDTYTLPVASETQLGGVQPVAKTPEMTQNVGIDSAGKLWTNSGGIEQNALISRVDALPDTVDSSTPDILAVGYEENTQFYLKLSPVTALTATPSTISLENMNGSSWSDQTATVTMSGGDGSPYEFGLSRGTIPEELAFTQTSEGNVCTISLTCDANKALISATTYSATLTCTCGTQTVEVPIELLVHSCLTGDTLITMANGTRKRIDEIKVGDKVLSFNPSTGLLQPDLVYSADSHLTKTHDHYDRYEFDDGTVIKVVHRHRFYNVDKQRMLHLDCWEIGDRAFKQNGSTVRLVKAQPHYEDVETLHYTIFTENQNYFANGLLSGNRFTKKLSKGVE